MSKKFDAFTKAVKLAPWKSKPQAQALRKNVALYLKNRKTLDLLPAKLRGSQKASAKDSSSPLTPLPGQAFDALYLAQSSLFRHSRALFLKAGGEFQARLASSPRSLSSAILLENRIQYSPTEDELFWMATDPSEKKNDERLLRIVSYSTSTFHEQTHRILWNILPLPTDRSTEGLRRYLNFIEAIVVGIDMALGDELGPEFSAFGYLSGTLYDPGSYAGFSTQRDRRNYLQIAIRATYLALEPFDSKKVGPAMSAWLPAWQPSLPKEAGVHAVKRALRLDDAFVEVTNLAWQKKHLGTFKAFLAEKTRKNSAMFTISDDPQSWIDPYLVVEKVLDHFGL